MFPFKLWRWIAYLTGWQRQVIALVCTMLAAIWMYSLPRQPLVLRFAELWLIYAGVLLCTMWISIVLLHPTEIKRRAASLDMAQNLIFTCVILTAIASLLAIIKLLHLPAGTLHGQWWVFIAGDCGFVVAGPYHFCHALCASVLLFRKTSGSFTW